MNGDGRPDLITSNDCAVGPCLGLEPGTIGVLLGNGDGTFQKAIVTFTLISGGHLAVADFNHDGKLDVACGQSDSLLLGNGDGTFQAPLILGVQGLGIATADFNLDGKPDIVSEAATMLLNISGGAGRPSPPSAAPRRGLR
jgi:hypothetical protein